MVTNAKCPLCGESIFFDTRPKIGQEFECENCESMLIVVNTDPVDLQISDYPIVADNGRNRNNERNQFRCPLCDAKLDLQKKVKLRSIIVCPDCDGELEVVGINPPELVWIYEEDEEDEELIYDEDNYYDDDDEDFDDDDYDDDEDY